MTQEKQGVAISAGYRPRVREPEKSSRAFAAYVDLLDTADWLREKMSRQLKTWNLTMMQFRVMETIHREGPQYQQELSRKFGCSKQNVGQVVNSLVGCGCLRVEVSHLERSVRGESSLVPNESGRKGRGSRGGPTGCAAAADARGGEIHRVRFSTAPEGSEGGNARARRA